MLHNYIDEPSAKIKAQHQYRVRNDGFIHFCKLIGEKRAGKY